MHTMHSTLLIGRYDWVPGELPKEEFGERIAALWQQVPPETKGIAVFGDRRSNAELVYLTNMVPKMRDALALFPRDGEPSIYSAGAPSMMATFGRQTWMGKPAPLSEPGKVLAEWKAKLGGPMVFIGGENLRLALRRGVDEAVGGDAASKQAGAALRAMMRPKRALEIAAVRRACAILDAMAKTLGQGFRAGKGPSAAVIDAEHEAVRMGAQEARSLLSLDGGRTLRPFMTPADKPADELQVYFAVRYAGYWAEGFIPLAKGRNPAADKASEALKKLIGLAVPGAKCSDLAGVLDQSSAPFGVHPATAGSAGSGIGLSLEEAPRVAHDRTEALQPGDVVSLRVGLSDGKKQHAIVSAIVSITASGSEPLWSAA